MVIQKTLPSIIFFLTSPFVFSITVNVGTKQHKAQKAGILFIDPQFAGHYNSGRHNAILHVKTLGENIMSTIEVKANKVDRTIRVEQPEILNLTSLADIVEALGEEHVLNIVQNGLKVAFRAPIRTKLEKKDDNGDFEFTDETILAEDYSDWKPTLRVTKSPEEKALELLGNLPPELRAQILANFNNA